MQKLTKFFQFAFLFFLLVLIFFEIWLGFPTSLELPSLSNPLPIQKDVTGLSVDKKMEDVHYVESRSGSRDWELYSGSAEGFEGSGEWALKNVKVLFYLGDKVEFTVTGDEGKIDSKTKDMEIFGHVTTRSNNGYLFQTDSVNYVSKDRMIRGQHAIKMSGPEYKNGHDFSIVSDAMDISVVQRLMTLKGKVLSMKKLADGRRLTVRSGATEFFGDRREVHFFNRVFIDIDAVQVEGLSAIFRYKGPIDFPSGISVEGDVRVSDRDKYATSQSLDYDPSQNKFTLQGYPRVVQNKDEVTGDKIILFDGGKRIRVEKMKARIVKSED